MRMEGVARTAAVAAQGCCCGRFAGPLPDPVSASPLAETRGPVPDPRLEDGRRGLVAMCVARERRGEVGCEAIAGRGWLNSAVPLEGVESVHANGVCRTDLA